MIARARATLAWIDTLPEPERTWASFGIPESEWARYSAWVEEALEAIRGTSQRVFHYNPRRMGYKQPVGYWAKGKGR